MLKNKHNSTDFSISRNSHKIPLSSKQSCLFLQIRNSPLFYTDIVFPPYKTNSLYLYTLPNFKNTNPASTNLNTDQ